MLYINDIHSKLNETAVHQIVQPETVIDLANIVLRARWAGRKICIAGGRHAMGSQQFLTDGVLVDMTRLNRVLRFDRERGLLEVEGGIQWPEIIGFLQEVQNDKLNSWCIRQKQTGADKLSIGGAVSANIHGRGLKFKPFIEDIESLRILDAQGRLLTCSRTENSELFGLVVGGYGLFGLIYSVTLRLVRTTPLKRSVRMARAAELMGLFEEAIEQGFTFGDFQFAIDSESDEFLREGIFSAYRPCEELPDEARTKVLSSDGWRRLVYLAHVDKSEAFGQYAKHYLSTDGQVYWSGKHQLGIYVDDYHSSIGGLSSQHAGASEIISELYVPRSRFVQFMESVRETMIARRADVIYGTVRLIEADAESFLPWAKEPYACIVFNLHTEHDEVSLRRTADTFRALIDDAIKFGGSYYLTYHKYARKDQLLKCYPEMPQFLAKKREYDPAELFSSNWYEHHKRLLLLHDLDRTGSVEHDVLGNAAKPELGRAF